MFNQAMVTYFVGPTPGRAYDEPGHHRELQSGRRWHTKSAVRHTIKGHLVVSHLQLGLNYSSFLISRQLL
jgi:hypothetical protein